MRNKTLLFSGFQICGASVLSVLTALLVTLPSTAITIVDFTGFRYQCSQYTHWK